MEITSPYRVKDASIYEKAFAGRAVTTKEEKLAKEYLRNMARLNLLAMPAGYAVSYF
ncbi:MAG TPA: hypothetical protein VFC74_01225 [Oscillospiraceae bacterium]|nr:hypothetical protein [Oscillospiraceae bacterium]